MISNHDPITHFSSNLQISPMLLTCFVFSQFKIPMNQLTFIPRTNQIKLTDTGVKITTVYKHDSNAIKLICITKNDKDLQKHVKIEVNWMKMFGKLKYKHPNIISGEYGGFEMMTPPDAIEEMDCHQIIMNYYPMDLHTRIHTISADNHVKINFIGIVIQQILRGLKHIHLRGIAHLDIKPENIFLENVNDEWHAVLGDLENMIKSKSRRGSIGTYLYMSPEMQNDYTQYHPIQADMYQLGAMVGVLILELSKIVEFDPHSETDRFYSLSHLFNRKSPKYRKSKLAQLNQDDMVDFVWQLTKTNPNERLTASQALNHQWMQKLTEHVDVLTEKDEQLLLRELEMLLEQLAQEN
eukprot:NODE_89_length_21781_cov_0.895836.p4 type:complete len:353 gc:universal NODE_89_length_21781_cov_0.895836:19374-18316(-)